tara:strand:- start:360 stop:521 length:162 start_codon:yes stop_codon:yes gene_type:complete
MKLTKSKLRKMIMEELDTRTYYEVRARRGSKVSEAIIFYTDEKGRVRRFDTER